MADLPSAAASPPSTPRSSAGPGDSHTMNVLGWAANLWTPHPSLPSGAIDVIAVRQPDGSLVCSPFHVKLGRTCKKGEKKLVKLRVNGKEVDVFMRLGPAGEAFFLKRTQDIERKSEDTLVDTGAMVGNIDCMLDHVTVDSGSNTPMASSSAPAGELACTGGQSSDITAAVDLGEVSKLDIAQATEADVPCQPVDPDAPSVDPLVKSSVIVTDTGDKVGALRPSGVSWVWRWGSLPVKSKSNLQLAAEFPPVIPSEDKYADTVVPSADKKFSEVRETFDDYQESLAGGKARAPRAGAPEDADALASPACIERPGFDVSSAASGKYKRSPGNSNEFRACEDEEQGRQCLPPSADKYFRALSLCGDKLVGEGAPTSPLELRELLYAHRVTQDAFLAQNAGVLSDSRLVVIADDHLLNVSLAKELLASAGSDPFAVTPVKPDLNPVQSLSVQLAVKALAATHPEDTLPSWLGARVSTWGANESDLQDSDGKSDYDLQEPLAHAHSQTSLGYYTPKKNLSFDKAQSQSNESPHVDEDFSTWSSSGIGWRESFTDLVEAFRLLQKKGSEKASSASKFSVSRGMSSIAELHESSDDYFFHHDSADERDAAQPYAVDLSLDGHPDESQESIVMLSSSAPHALPDLPEEAATAPRASLTNAEPADGDTDQDHISLQDVPFEDISPEPADGDFYESDTDSYLSLSLEEGESAANNIATRATASLASLSFFGTSAATAAAQAKDGEDCPEVGGPVSRRHFRRYRYRKVLCPSKEQLELFGLKDGQNELVFELDDCEPLISQLFVWPHDAKVVVTDIEGVFLSSQQGSSGGWIGLLELGKKGPVCRHEAINLLRAVHDQGYRVIYVADSPSTTSNRSTNYSNFILSTVQNQLGQRLPAGPVFKSPDSLIRAFGPARTEVFKAAALRGVRGLFPPACSPFFAAFVSRESDVVAFDRNGFPSGRVFLADQAGQLRRILQNRDHALSVAEVRALLAQIFPKIKDGQGSRKGPSEATPAPTPAAASAPDAAPAGEARSNPSALCEENFSDALFWKLPLPPLDDI